MSGIKKLILDGGNFTLDTTNIQSVNITTNRELLCNNVISANNFVINDNGSQMSQLFDNGYINFYTENNNIDTDLLSANTSYDIKAVYVLSESKNFTSTNTNNTISITYSGSSRVCNFNMHFRASSSQSLNCTVFIQKNANIVPNGKYTFETVNNTEFLGFLCGLIILNTNDVITLKISADNTGSVLVSDIGLVLSTLI